MEEERMTIDFLAFFGALIVGLIIGFATGWVVGRSDKASGRG